MPILKIFTNISRQNVPQDFMDKLIPLLSRTLNKPRENFRCCISTDCLIGLHGGDATTPGAVGTLESIGNLGPQENKVIIKELSALIEKELGISPERFCLTFYDLSGYNVGAMGITH